MPRNSQGLYALPVGNPVVSGTTIESVWANNTMGDIADALTASLPRNGSAPMTGPLTLSADAITGARQATTKAYVDQFMAYSSGFPVGAISAYGGVAAPAGWLRCNGAAVSRTTYADLFAVIGTTYGSGDASTTFNLPDLRSEFIRGRDDARAVGSKQAASFAAHTHGVTDPGHGHNVSATQAAHSHTVTTGGHTHSVNDPGHAHNYTAIQPTGSGPWGGSNVLNEALEATAASGTGISINAVGDLGGNTNAQQPTVTVAQSNAVTGVSLGSAGGTETVPQNTALDYYIKALNDGTGAAVITGISSSDPQMVSIDNTIATIPELLIHSNVAFGTVKLDASGSIPLSLLPSTSQALLGFFDASAGQTPSEAYPTTNFASGDTYIVSVTGLLTVYDPVTLTASPTTVNPGFLLQYVENSLTNPTGWYYVTNSSTVVASQVGLTPVGSIAATDVQAGFAEVDGDLISLAGGIATLDGEVNALQTADGFNTKRTSSTGAALIPAGTTAERDTSVIGAFRYNITTNNFEGLSSLGWGQVGGGQMYGTAPVKAVFFNSNTIAENLVVKAGENGGTFGPVTVADGFSVTVENGSTWSIV